MRKCLILIGSCPNKWRDICKILIFASNRKATLSSKGVKMGQREDVIIHTKTKDEEWKPEDSLSLIQSIRQAIRDALKIVNRW